MKIRASREAGNTLLVVLLITGMLVAATGTYLDLIMQEHSTVKRSLSWNAAMPMAEAGIEEVLSHLNRNTNNYLADGWTTNYARERTLGHGSYSVSFSGNPGSLVLITSTGSITTATSVISRTVRVTALTRKDFKFPGLSVVINFGGTFHADSYDSGDTNASTLGMYDKTKAGDQARIESPGTGFDLGGNATVAGFVASGPKGTVTSSGSTSVGDRSWVRSNKKGIQPGHFTNDCTFTFPAVQAPYDSGDLPGTNNVSGTNYDYVLDAGQYYASNLNSTVYGGTMLVKDTSTIYVTGNIALNKIVFAPGARLDFYVGAPAITFAPTLVGATAPQFTIFALPSCLSLTLNSSTVFYGLIYAPSTDLVAAGGAQISGAIVGKSFHCNGTFDFHFDLAFNKPRTDPPVKILSWTEL